MEIDTKRHDKLRRDFNEHAALDGVGCAWCADEFSPFSLFRVGAAAQRRRGGGGGCREAEVS